MVSGLGGVAELLFADQAVDTDVSFAPVLGFDVRLEKKK